MFVSEKDVTRFVCSEEIAATVARDSTLNVLCDLLDCDVFVMQGRCFIANVLHILRGWKRIIWHESGAVIPDAGFNVCFFQPGG